MDLVKIRELAFKQMGTRKAHLEREKGGIYYHGQRTADIAIKLRKHLFPEDDSHDDIIKAACYFHDCAKGIEPHAEYGVAVGRKALKDYVTAEELDMICELIDKHQDRSKNDNTTSDYVKIVQDADLLDHFGVYGVWMCFQYRAHLDETMLDAVKYNEENFEDFVTHNRKIINYDISKKIFDEKVAFEKMFYDRLKAEANGGIILDF